MIRAETESLPWVAVSLDMSPVHLIRPPDTRSADVVGSSGSSDTTEEEDGTPVVETVSYKEGHGSGTC